MPLILNEQSENVDCQQFPARDSLRSLSGVARGCFFGGEPTFQSYFFVNVNNRGQTSPALGDLLCLRLLQALGG